MLCAQTFLAPQMSTHKQYEALRAYYVEELSAAEVADRFGYTRACLLLAPTPSASTVWR